MSQPSVSVEKARSSVRQLDVSRTYEQEKERRVEDSYSTDANSGSEAPKEERLEKASELMEITEAENLDVGVGELVKVTSDLIVERTQTGFNAYVVAQE